MELNEFFKPTARKIIILFILLILTIFIPKTDEVCSPGPITEEIGCSDIQVHGFGYPLFYGEMFYGDAGEIGFNPLIFMLNIIVGYLVSCLILHIYNNMKSKE